MSFPTFIERLENRQLMAAAPPQFTQTDLVSDGGVTAQHTDANLVNGWGLAFTKQGVVWVGNNTTGTSTVYDVNGNVAGPVVTIPPAAGQTTNAAVTGVAFNASPKSFFITSSGLTVPSQYVYVSEDGTISGWEPSIGNTAVNVVDNSASGAVYKGNAILGKGKKALLLVANFKSGAIEVYDSNFQPVTTVGGFVDPSLPAGYAPFNVQTIGKKVFVAYALQGPGGVDEVSAPGNGAVSVFDAKGNFKQRLATGGPLNSPWAVVPGTGKNKSNLLVGNFGDGTINVFTKKGESLGPAQDLNGNTIVIDGLWGLAYGTGANKKTLFFAAGPNEELSGLFGSLTLKVTPKPSGGGGGDGGGGFPY